jgi:hypothetical protein
VAERTLLTVASVVVIMVVLPSISERVTNGRPTAHWHGRRRDTRGILAS